MKACSLCAARLSDPAPSCWRCGGQAGRAGRLPTALAAPTEGAPAPRRRGLRAVAFAGVLLAGAALALPTVGARQLSERANADQAWAEWHGQMMREAREGTRAVPGEQAAPRLPPGHPPVRSAEPRLPPGHPPVDAQPALPPGHPPVDRFHGTPGPLSPLFEAPVTLDT